MKLEVGNRIFYQKNGEFYVDRIADILSTKEGTLYELVDYDWLRYHARNYYESDSWSLFKDEDMVKDLCKAMLYK